MLTRTVSAALAVAGLGAAACGGSDSQVVIVAAGRNCAASLDAEEAACELDFGSVPVSLTEGRRIVCDASSSNLSITSFDIGGEEDGTFLLISETAGEQAAALLQFTPQVAGPADGLLQIQLTDSHTVIVQLLGEGV